VHYRVPPRGDSEARYGRASAPRQSVPLVTGRRQPDNLRARSHRQRKLRLGRDRIEALLAGQLDLFAFTAVALARPPPAQHVLGTIEAAVSNGLRIGLRPVVE
jgi:hypothetical protein